MATTTEQLEQELADHPGRVVVVAGAGVSAATTNGQACSSWRGLLKHGLQECLDVCGTDSGLIGSQSATLDNPAAEPDDWIGVAQFITCKLQNYRPGCFGEWLVRSVGALRAEDRMLVRAIESVGGKLATTNYDDLIEQVIGRSPVTWREPARALEFWREDGADVLHIHGHFRQPHSVIFGSDSYSEILNDGATQNLLRNLLTSGTLMFVGCGGGIEDPNFGRLLDWLKDTHSSSHFNHFFLTTEGDFAGWRGRLKGINIDPIPYGPRHKDLPPYLMALAERVRRRRDQKQAAPDAALSRAQSEFGQQWGGLEPNSAEVDFISYFRQSQEIAASLWLTGGRRRAALEFSGRLTRYGDGLSASEYIHFALQAIEWLLDEELPDYAARQLQRIEERSANATVSDEDTCRVQDLRIRCFDALCLYPNLLRAIEAALPGADPHRRGRLEAERAEIQMLQGDFDAAEASSEGAE